jgi:uncharacterized membrane protein YbhN (UPF0104 family)
VSQHAPPTEGDSEIAPTTEASPAAAAEPTSRWQHLARITGLVILIAVSIHGIREFMAGDAQSMAAMWQRSRTALPLVFVFAVLDVAIEALAWALVFERFKIRALDRVGAAVAVSGKAGLLLPAQLGRLVRPDLVVRLGRGTLGQALKAEAVVFLLDSASVAALLASLVTFRFYPVLSPLAGFVVVATCLFLANRIAPILSGTALELPADFWLHWKTFGIVAVQSAGWFAHGFAFWVLGTMLDGNVGIWESLFLAPGSAVIGLGSGLPGGLGVTEAMLGASLNFGGVPQAQLAVGVAFFRVLTFWVWIPIGWLAFAYASWAARRRRVLLESQTQETPEDSP